MNKHNQKHGTCLVYITKKLWALYLTYHLNWWLTFKFWCTIQKSIKKKSWKISHKNLENRSHSNYIHWFFFRILILVIIVFVVVYRHRRGKKFCISISNCFILYQLAYLDEVRSAKVILFICVFVSGLDFQEILCPVMICHFMYRAQYYQINQLNHTKNVDL